MENAAIALDSTVRSQDSNNSKNSKDSKDSKDSNASDSKPESCLESKHSKEILISEKQQRQQPRTVTSTTDDRQKLKNKESKDESTILMFTSCGQLLLGRKFSVILYISCYFYYFVSNIFSFYKILNFILFYFVSLIKIHFVENLY